MKALFQVMICTGLFLTASSVYAGGGNEHDHKILAGPKGGRILENTQPHAEFFVEKDLSVTVSFYDKDLKPVPATDQSVSVIADAEGKKTTIDFEKKGDVLVSKEPLPHVHAVNLVVRLKQSPDSQFHNFRFVYEDHICPVCNRAEYACICGH